MKHFDFKRLLLFAVVSLFLQGCSGREFSQDNPPESQDTALVAEPAENQPKAVALEQPAEEWLLSNASLWDMDFDGYLGLYDQAVMLLSDGVTVISYNESFAGQRHSPCSTFKIPHALIALETGVITMDDSFKAWNGARYSRSELNQDQDIKSAIKHSCVWYFQLLANNIGNDPMQEYLDRMNYGNRDISGGIDLFWLNSSLLISPEEQLDFITKLYHNELPFQNEHMDYIKSAIKLEGYPVDIFGKTGSSGDGMGWFVGYALVQERPLFFVTYIEADGASGLDARDITTQIIERLNNRF